MYTYVDIDNLTLYFIPTHLPTVFTQEISTVSSLYVELVPTYTDRDLQVNQVYNLYGAGNA